MYHPDLSTGPPTLRDLAPLARGFPSASALALGESGVERVSLPGPVAELFDEYSAPESPAGSERTPLGLMTVASRTRVIVAFDRCRRVGYAQCAVENAEGAGEVAITLWDFRNSLGVIICVVVPGLTLADEAAGGQADLRPRRLEHTASDTGIFLTVDDATELLLGWTREELVGQPRVDFCHPEDLDIAIANWVDMLGAPGESRRVRLQYRHKNGSWLWFEVTQTNRLHDLGYVHCELLDVSLEQAALSALRDREALLARLTAALPTGVLHLSPGREVLFHNARFVEISGFDPSDEATLGERVEPADQIALDAAFNAALIGVETDLDLTLLVHGQQTRCHLSFRPLDQGGCLVCLNDITERWRMQEELAHRATTDPLTGLLNRGAVLDALERRLESDREQAVTTSVVFLDLDDFKIVNDLHGHATGDCFLVEVASALRFAVRPDDLVGRLGGDEFLVVFSGVEDVLARSEVLDRLRSAATRTFTIGNTQAECLVSCGMAVDIDRQATAGELVAAADAAMYAEKALHDQVRKMDATGPSENLVPGSGHSS